jgi:hypothetical protein
VLHRDALCVMGPVEDADALAQAQDVAVRPANPRVLNNVGTVLREASHVAPTSLLSG